MKIFSTTVQVITLIILAFFFLYYFGSYTSGLGKILESMEGDSMGWGEIFNAMFFIFFVFTPSLIIIIRYSNPTAIKLIDISLLILGSILYFAFTSYIPKSYAQADIFKFIAYWAIPSSLLLASFVVVIKKYSQFYPAFLIFFILIFVCSLLYINLTLAHADSAYKATQTWEEQKIGFKITVPAYFKFSYPLSETPYQYFKDSFGVYLSSDNNFPRYFKEKYNVPTDLSFAIFKDSKLIPNCDAVRPNFKDQQAQKTEFDENSLHYCQWEGVWRDDFNRKDYFYFLAIASTSQHTQAQALYTKYGVSEDYTGGDQKLKSDCKDLLVSGLNSIKYNPDELDKVLRSN